MVNYDAGVYSDTLLIGEYTPPNPLSMAFNLDKNIIDVSGEGYLSGKFPDGIVTIEQVPTEADITIAVRSRHGSLLDNIVVATTTSGQDGTWLVSNLSKFLRFNVMARKIGCRDIVVSDVKPF